MVSSSTSTVRTLHFSISETTPQKCQSLNTSSPPVDSIASTPHLPHIVADSIASSLVLPSPPDSPSLSPIHSAMHSPSFDSVSESSLPSVSSSFFFSSSAAASPGRSRNSSYPQSEHEQDQDHPPSSQPPLGHNLIIPTLSLPSALRRPTPFGQTLGALTLLVLGAQGAGKSFLTGLLLEENEDVVDVGTWEDWEEGVGAANNNVVADTDVDGSFSYGKVLRASTDWVERKDTFGLERFEPTQNVHIVELPGYSQDAEVSLYSMPDNACIHPTL